MTDQNRIGAYLIAGLGNPGKRYENTRHNIGFMVVEALSKAYSIPLNLKGDDVDYGRGVIEGSEVILIKPMSFMNLSGQPILGLAESTHRVAEDILIIHDDLDLTFSRLKIKRKGGHGGHNGLRSITESLGTEKYTRLRMGIGRPEEGGEVVKHVLGNFSEAEREALDQMVNKAVEAVVTIVTCGVTAGMNKFN